jgi:ATP-dependent helicase HrpA
MEDSSESWIGNSRLTGKFAPPDFRRKSIGKIHFRPHFLSPPVNGSVPLTIPASAVKSPVPEMKFSASNELREILPNCLRHDRERIEARLRVPGENGISEKEWHGLLARARRSVQLRHLRHERVPPVDYPANLPITAKREEIVGAIRRHPVVIIAGETGSGKTTQIPKMCLEAGLGIEGKIGCTQPRRIAALTISKRIAAELNRPWGRDVGCKIRFSDSSSPETYIKVMTDGILLAETQGDPELGEYEAIVIDEAHERSLNIDFLLGYLKSLLSRRPDLKLIITSATLDTKAFSEAFGGAPIIEVSGRMFPVEIRHQPAVDNSDEEDLSHVDAAVRAAGELFHESNSGDVLIFMPTERDIRETEDKLNGSLRGLADVIPLFGRLSSGDQERAFTAGTRRRIIVATNIAETSLTLPGIRYVIDTGLARISRYSPRTRTKRLPIEPISQSSARQRAGRCGRVQDGVCVRLYSEEDFAARPAFTQPEIQRANLAEVILKMKAFRLGDIEVFPFINAPAPRAIQEGYRLLQELGALDDDRNVTEIGRQLARLPVDPTAGRIILEAALEGALEEALIISAGMSVPDPRERPADQLQAAQAAHREFLDPESDFLSYLKLWEACDAAIKNVSNNQFRKFCQSRFLSRQRIREWRDIHAQLRDAAEELLPEAPNRNATPAAAVPQRKTGKGISFQAPNYAAIHRSILSGLLSHVAQRVERNLYRGIQQRQLSVFPGSSLFDRRENRPAKKSNGPTPSAAAEKSFQPQWIVAGEIVETSRLYARTVAGIDPEWILELGAHVCKQTFTEPVWDTKAQRVLAKRKTMLSGLVVDERRVDFCTVNPAEATAMFVQCALIDGEVEAPWPFLEHNRQLRNRIEVWRSRTRDQRLPDLDDALRRFYSARIQNVSSTHDLNRLIRDRAGSEPRFLHATEEDLTGGEALHFDTEAFPAEVRVAEHPLAVHYTYAPGEEPDGATVEIPASLVPAIPPDAFDWLIPGTRREQIEILLRALPKSIRVPLMPLAPKIEELAAALQPGGGFEQIRRLIHAQYGAQIPSNAWDSTTLPAHLTARIAVLGPNGKVVASGRDFAVLRGQTLERSTPADRAVWERAAAHWEKFDLRAWTMGDLPERIELESPGGTPLFAFPGLTVEDGVISLRLFRDRESALQKSRLGFRALAEEALSREFGWLEKDLRPLSSLKDLYVTIGPGAELSETALRHLKNALVNVPAQLIPLRAGNFETCVAEAKTRFAGAAQDFIQLLSPILKQRQELLLLKSGYPEMRAELDELVGPRFLEKTPGERLRHFPRYLKGMKIRAERAAVSAAKDAEKARQLRPFQNEWRALRKTHSETNPLVEEFRWAMEEFKISVFAQELGTAQPVSSKRLEKLLHEIRQGFPASGT